jgi:hypothetical protein
MPFATAVRQPSVMSRVYVYFDSYKDLRLGGRLYVYNGSVELKFNGMIEMLKNIEGAFDRLAYPQSTFGPRTFDESHDKKTSEGMEYPKMEQLSGAAEHEKKATFIIHVKYRQNATWQGEIKWVNKNKVQYFRSSLEMIKLMDLALAEEFGKDVEIEWD